MTMVSMSWQLPCGHLAYRGCIETWHRHAPGIPAARHWNSAWFSIPWIQVLASGRSSGGVLLRCPFLWFLGVWSLNFWGAFWHFIFIFFVLSVHFALLVCLCMCRLGLCQKWAGPWSAHQAVEVESGARGNTCFGPCSWPRALGSDHCPEVQE